MALLTVRLFGRLNVRLGDKNLDSLPGGKIQELLCYLLLHIGELHSRETLAALFWPDCTNVKSKKYLRQALWQLKTSLKSGLDDSNPEILLTDSKSVHLTHEEPVWVDVAAFEKACNQAKGLSWEQFDASTVNELHRAVELYRGDLLEGCYQDWCLYERERLQDCYLCLLDKLICYWLNHNDYPRAIEYGEHVLRRNRAHERTHRQLMHLHYENGDRTAALYQYERCAAALRDELGVEPSHQTKRLFEQLRADQVEPANQISLSSQPKSSPDYLNARGN
jgi:DNA-binding SARP family transcriptional activator